MLKLNIKKTFHQEGYGYQFTSQATKVDMVKKLCALGFSYAPSLEPCLHDPERALLVDTLRMKLDWDYRSEDYPFYMNDDDLRITQEEQAKKFALVDDLSQEDIYDALKVIVGDNEISINKSSDPDLLSAILLKGEARWNAGERYDEYTCYDNQMIHLEFRRERLRISHGDTRYSHHFTPSQLLGAIKAVVAHNSIL